MSDQKMQIIVQSLNVQAPEVPRKPITLEAHGILRQDDYAWLRADNWQKVLTDPDRLPKKIRTVLEAENRYCDQVLAAQSALREKLWREMRGRIKEEDSAPAMVDGPFAYYSRTRRNGQHEILCRRPRAGGPEQMLLDGDLEAQGKAFFELSAAVHSPDHRLLAWACDDKGSELHSIYIRDLSSGRDLPQKIEGASEDIVWTRNSDSFYYILLDENYRPSRVMRHKIGQLNASDQLIYEETDEALFVSLHGLQAEQFAVISSFDHAGNRLQVIDLTREAPLREIVPRTIGERHELEHWQGRWVLRTNAQGAQDFKIVTAPIDQPQKAQWSDLVPHRPGHFITEIAVFRDYLVRMESVEALPQIVVRPVSGQEHVIAFSEPAYDLDLEKSLEFDTSILRFSYSSMTTPEEIYDYDMATQKRTLIKRQDIPSGHDRAAYKTLRLYAQAADGATIPISLLFRADRVAQASPLLLYSYGAYGSSIPASFSSNRLSLVDRGFVYALAHIRGGADKGWNWYQDGKLQHKQNSFSDFITCARSLIDQGWTSAGRIVAYGGSAGGLLMGAVANQAPELFAGIIADVPFVDVLNTILDDSLPLTPPEWEEWGNPITDLEAYRTIAAYSPYDNVRAQFYPPILVEAGLTDPRVTYWEPAKWVAKLRAYRKGAGPVLLHTSMEAGHGGASGRFEQLKETARIYAFAIACVTPAAG